jgi:hypothetical protein
MAMIMMNETKPVYGPGSRETIEELDGFEYRSELTSSRHISGCNWSNDWNIDIFSDKEGRKAVVDRETGAVLQRY